jgi:hypothetical protein
LFLPYQLASLEGLSHGLYVVWLIEYKHLNAEAVALLMAAGDLALMGLEVPTGWLADRFGHRGSLIAGSMIQTAAMALLWCGQGIVAMGASILFIAVGDAFRSGADEALLFQTCRQLGHEDWFARILSTTRAVTIASMAGLIVLGGKLAATVGPDVTLAADAALCALGVLLALALKPVPAMESDSESESESDSESKQASSSSTRSRTIARHVSTIIFPAVVAGTLVSSAELLVQASWKGSLENLSWVIAGVLLAESVGSLLAGMMRVRVSLGVLGCAALIAGIGSLLWPAVSLWTLALLAGWAGPLRSEQIQKQASEGERAQAASWAGLADMAGTTLMLPLSTLVAQRAGAPIGMLAATTVLGLIWLGGLLVSRAQRPFSGSSRGDASQPSGEELQKSSR